ncbi:MAG: hypothetical protein U0S36_12525 [Candidatus Nanopelagicales bacterium]
MSSIAFDCTQCGNHFESSAFDVAPGVTATLVGNMTDCPQCGGMARQARDGKYLGTDSGPARWIGNAD